jgi:hypothetical protein
VVFIGYQRLTIRYEAPRPFCRVPSSVSSRSADTKLDSPDTYVDAIISKDVPEHLSRS